MGKERGHRVDQIRRGGRLHHFAVQLQLDLDRVGRTGLVRRDERGTAGRRSVEHLARDPLRGGELEVARGQVVQQHVPRDVVEGVFHAHVLGRMRPHHERHLGLVIHLLACRGKLHLAAGRHQGVAELGEEGGDLGRLHARLRGVRAVVEPDADDLVGIRDRRQQLHLR